MLLSNPPYISIAYWGGKRHKPSSSPLVTGINQSKVDRPDAESEDAVEDVPGTMYEFPYLSNWGYVNKNGTMGEISWARMGQEEVQDQPNGAYKYYISVIDIILHY